MADTIRNNFPHFICSDCGTLGVAFIHTGPLVPKGTIGYFCIFCWQQRLDAEKRGEPPKPLGAKPPGVPEEFNNRAIKVTTKSGSVYEFGAPNEQEERTVSCTIEDMDFNRCRILCSIIGRDLWIKPFGSPDTRLHLWTDLSVVSIE
jgi:hypothetical protein